MMSTSVGMLEQLKDVRRRADGQELLRAGSQNAGKVWTIDEMGEEGWESGESHDIKTYHGEEKHDRTVDGGRKSNRPMENEEGRCVLSERLPPGGSAVSFQT